MLRVSAARREGRGHRTRGTPCQDAFAVWQDPVGGRVAAAVADGLGSKPLSHLGSEAATQAAVASLAAEPTWDEDAVARAFEAARQAVQDLAAARGVPINDLATTLQVATWADGTVHAGMVGDGAVVAGAIPAAAAAIEDRGGDGDVGERHAEVPDGPRLRLDAPSNADPSPDLDPGPKVDPSLGLDPSPHLVVAPADAEYSNEVVPLTYSGWREFLRFGRTDGAAWMMLFTDGLTRLLLSRAKTEWRPYRPFFDAYVPKLEGPAFDEGIAARLLAAKNVDDSWDDDKCLVVIASGRAT